MVKLVVLTEENIRLFGKMPDGTLTYTVRQSDLTGKDVFEERGDIDTFLNEHGIKFSLKKTLLNSILHPELVKKRRKKRRTKAEILQAKQG